VRFAAEYEARLREGSDIQDHLPRLFAEASGGKRIIELGVRGGNSCAAFLAAVERDGGHVWSVDIVEPHVPAEWHESSLWTFVLGDDIQVAHLLPNTVDVVFVDTSHHLGHTAVEIGMYAPKLRPGGVMLFHDTELERPYEAPADDPPFPVRVAIDGTAESWGWQTEFVSGCSGLGILRKPEA
jgi:predicted O-methyltransferase YrrM